MMRDRGNFAPLPIFTAIFASSQKRYILLAFFKEKEEEKEKEIRSSEKLGALSSLNLKSMMS